MKPTIIGLALVLGLQSSPLFAQAVVTADFSTSLTTAAKNCVPGLTTQKTLYIENPYGSGGNVGYCVGNSCTPVIGSAGTSVLTPGEADFWPAGSAPGEAVQCIGSVAVPVTIRSGR